MKIKLHQYIMERQVDARISWLRYYWTIGRNIRSFQALSNICEWQVNVSEIFLYHLLCDTVQSGSNVPSLRWLLAACLMTLTNLLTPMSLKHQRPSIHFCHLFCRYQHFDACVCVCVCMCLCVCMCVGAWVGVCVCVGVCMSVCVWMCVNLYECVCGWVYECMFACLCVYECVYVYEYMCACLCVCVYECVFMCMSVWVYECVLLSAVITFRFFMYYTFDFLYSLCYIVTLF